MTSPSRGRKVLEASALAVAAVAILGAWLLTTGRDHPLLGRPAPDFRLPLINGEGAEEGDLLRMSDLRGQVVVLDFWATWCPPCRASIPVLARVATAVETRGVRVLGVDVESLPPAVAGAAHRRLGATFPSVQDAARQVAAAYHVDVLPTLVVIDRAGIVRGVLVGDLPEDRILREILRVSE
jgi:thiol-disulfide isomerase/thioredoxin